MRVFELTKSRYPNWWYLIRLSYFYDIDGCYTVRDMCTAIRRGIIGFVYACILPWAISFLIMAFLEPLLCLVHGSFETVFFELTSILGVFLWICIISITGTIVAFFILEEEYGNLGGRISNVIGSGKPRSNAKQPSAFAVWYAGIKDKYCPMVRLVDDISDDDDDDEDE